MTDRRDLEVSNRVLTVPNVLSALRLAGVPVFVFLLLGPRADGWALAILLISGGTDWLDGKLARVLGQASKLGAILDPLVDRLYVVTTLVAFVLRGIIPWWVAAILIGRDAILGLTLIIYRRRALPPPDVIYLGKAATFAVMIALPVLLVSAGSSSVADIAAPVGWALLVWGTVLYTWTGLLYLGKALAVARTIPPSVPAESRP